MKTKWKYLFLILTILLITSCGVRNIRPEDTSLAYPHLQGRKGAPYESICILPENPYGENFTQDKTLFAPPVDSNLSPVSELHLRNGEMESFRVLFPAETGTIVKSISKGIVVKTQNKRPPDMNEEELQLSMLGKYVIVDIGDGISIRYAHLSDVTVEEGASVSSEDEIGIVGYSGVALPQSKQAICGIYILENGLQVNPLKYFQMPDQFEINVFQ